MANGRLTNRQHAFLAYYLGECRFNATKAAEAAGYRTPGQAGYDLLKIPEIQDAVREWRSQVKAGAIATMEYRVSRLEEIERKYWDLIDQRSTEMADEVAGGNTGLLVRQHKSIGSGEFAREVIEYKADTAVTQEIRDTYQQAAKELGQWTEKAQFAGPNGGAIPIVAVEVVRSTTPVEADA